MGLRVSLGSYCPGGDGDDGSSNEKSTWMQAILPAAVTYCMQVGSPCLAKWILCLI